MPKNNELAAKLLSDAATFFETIARDNPALSEQMEENSDVFRQVADLVSKDPIGEVEEEKENTTTNNPVFRKREKWIDTVYGDSALGEPLEFSYRADRIEWEEVDHAEILALVDMLDEKTLEGDRALLKSARVWCCSPGFYPGAKLYHAVTPESDGLFVEYTPEAGIGLETEFVALGADSSILSQVNRGLPVALDGWEYDYLLFFLYSLQSDLGKFRIVQGKLSDYVRQALLAHDLVDVSEKLFKPQFLRFAGDGGCIYQVLIIYADRLFSSKFKVSYNGFVEMIDDETFSDEFNHLESVTS